MIFYCYFYLQEADVDISHKLSFLQNTFPIISAAFLITLISALFSKINFNKWNEWTSFLNNISLLDHMKNSKLYISSSTRAATTNLRREWHKLRGCHLSSHMSLWSRGHVMSCDKIERYISTYTRLIKIKPDAVVTYGVRLPHVKWQNS